MMTAWTRARRVSGFAMIAAAGMVTYVMATVPTPLWLQVVTPWAVLCLALRGLDAVDAGPEGDPR
jgi:hypothetical protein